jgi:hypothetical protein
VDTSPEYIKMCEQAEEIQVIAPGPELGDMWAYLRPKEGSQWGCIGPIVRAVEQGYDGDADFSYVDEIERAWLPRQDQLQEMVDWRPLVGCGIVAAMYHRLYPNNQLDDYYFDFTSLEQIWLAFVMKEKYGKVWNGETWEKEA